MQYSIIAVLAAVASAVSTVTETDSFSLVTRLSLTAQPPCLLLLTPRLLTGPPLLPSPLTRVPVTSNTLLVPSLWLLVLCWLCKLVDSS
ncbi:hypothetical protein METBIDRAFT_179497 [Metschnikowia bicuspidata var. bicuspidata NRRL YB-4993]|uniref:Secreted protein n=1 Tax=Metschnikowia bicuspidata var. bicuspidata NRRL YB-4993 TaxID=869754 RepID=A0A1A0HBD0_9ASCO|nr:hypothetical protein METBIDRAFT_179497 [Metschnikowia bicuspidata var. bicuspidata NRRL YB-4993]OBA21295.1 hypothetical protein METBIDRAFT_179497 [Metschnikowia bicuspidata var. bicuspidata NRRL YB-4993]